MNCEFCDKPSIYRAPGEKGWWLLCPECKSSWYKVLLKGHNE